MKYRNRLALLAVALASLGSGQVFAQAGRVLSNGVCKVELSDDGTVTVSTGPVSTGAVASRVFRPRWIVLRADVDPKLEQRLGQFGDPKLEKMYNVLSWSSQGAAKPAAAARGEGGPTASAGGPDGKGHVEDGFDPKADRAMAGRTVDWFSAGSSQEVVATGGNLSGDAITWKFPTLPDFELSASLTLPAGSSEPVLAVTCTPKVSGWWSVVYAGAPVVTKSEAQEIFQPLIWQDLRVPNKAYLTEAYRCTVPATLVRSGGVTSGVVVDPAELPFQPLPTLANSRFGMSVVNEKAELQSVAAAPIMGGAGSKRESGDTIRFTVRLLVREGSVSAAYQHIAQSIYGFRDYRHNVLGSLNTTLENTVDFAMSEWARFNSELRGAAYDTDVPGSVKNISALHPLGASMVMDDERLFNERARPMIEYAVSRERFLFTTDPTVKGQSASSKLDGPGVSLTEMTALFEMSRSRSPVFIKLAEKVWGKNRSLNLDAVLVGESWQNALAMYRGTGDRKWLEKSMAGADAYIAQRIATRQTDYKDPESRGMFFWTSFAPNWMELQDLYEQTGEKRYLQAASDGARAFAQYIYLCPQIPSGTVTVNEGGMAPRYRNSPKLKPIPAAPETVDAWRVSEMGLTCESAPTSKGHRGIFLTSFAPWMLRLAADSDDKFLHDIGRSAVIGRYRAFPGYHINTARTTVYESVDFARRPMEELNSTTSLHYNHIWSQVAMLIDYLVSDVEARSAGAVKFPAVFSEGYAYVQSRVYGHAAGTVYGDKDVWLWMPKGAVSIDNGELNYLVARGSNTVYLVLTNQCDQEVDATVTLNPKLMAIPAGASSARQWRQNVAAEAVSLSGGNVKVKVAPKGLTVLAFDGVRADVQFQQKLAGMKGGGGWKNAFTRMAPGNTTAAILDFGDELRSAYVYLEATGETYKSVTLTWKSGNQSGTVEDTSYPFEWTVPLSAGAEAFEFNVKATKLDGSVEASEMGVLGK